MQIPKVSLNTLAFSVEQILVVTFTDAATQEIKDRVRSRIIAAQRRVAWARPKRRAH